MKQCQNFEFVSLITYSVKIYFVTVAMICSIYLLLSGKNY